MHIVALEDLWGASNIFGVPHNVPHTPCTCSIGHLQEGLGTWNWMIQNNLHTAAMERGGVVRHGSHEEVWSEMVAMHTHVPSHMQHHSIS